MPRGFRGSVTTFAGLCPQSGRTLVLPEEGGQRDRALPDEDRESCDTVVVERVTESMGPIEGAVAGWTARLAPGGTLLLEVHNRQSLRQLRMVLEGRPGSLEALDLPEDPCQALPLKRVLAACTASGLLVQDVIRVPGWNPGHPDLPATLCRVGFLPMAWVTPPPDRFWLVCARIPAQAGTVLIGPGTAADQSLTESAVRAFLPADWEVVRCEDGAECAAFNRGVTGSRGDLLWLLRAGARPTAALFAELALHADAGPAVPGVAGQRAFAGDVTGLMLPRHDLLLAGPLPESFCNDPIGLEEWCMTLDGVAPEAAIAEAGLDTPPAPIADAAAFAAEAEAMLARWRPVVDADAASPSTATADAAEPAPWAGRAPRISLCMITRDEEQFLAQCLTLARAAVDEIVVVDTGSRDRTVAIAESFGARVLHRPWDDDFSAPRNLALAHATGDWILVLDADEMLEDPAPERLRELSRDAGVVGYHLHFTNAYGGGKTLGVMMVRLFRNLPGVGYRNVIHEQVTPSLLRVGAERGLTIANSDVQVTHLGYTDAMIQARSKNERNERLFQKQLAQDPDDIYSLYKYGDFLRTIPGRQRDARDTLQRCLDLILASPPSLPRELPFAGEVAALCALEHAREERHDVARRIVATALRRFIPTPNLHYIAGNLDLYAQRNDSAIWHFRRCLGYRGQVLVVPVQPGITGHIALAGIAQAWLQKGDHARARRLLERAIALEPTNEISHLALSRLHLFGGDPAAALRTLTDYLTAHPDSPGACQQTTLILHRMGYPEQARRMGERALHLLQRDAREHEAEHMQRILAAIH